MTRVEIGRTNIASQIIEAFSANDANGAGSIDRELLVTLLLVLRPSLERADIESLLTATGLPKSGSVSYESFVLSLFDDEVQGDHCMRLEARCEGPMPEQEGTSPQQSNLLYGKAFVHGAGDCDQLGLGDAMRERRKPTLVRALAGVRMISVACGGLHTICTTAEGQLYSWGCGDDGALGRPSSGSDCEPGRVQLPESISVQNVACGDSHSCMVDLSGKVWLWGSYRDTTGFIGIVGNNQNVVERSFVPNMLIGLDGISAVASGSNHTIVSGSCGQAFVWGSNQSSQLGLQSRCGCEFVEEQVSCSVASHLMFVTREGSGVVAVKPDLQSPAVHVLSISTQDGRVLDATQMQVAEVQELAGSGVSLLTSGSRSVSLQEKQSLLVPQKITMNNIASPISNVYASAECTFVTTSNGRVHGCGLNSSGQVGTGLVGTVVFTMACVAGVENAEWIGGGLHMSAALVAGEVFTWGRAEECGHGLGAGSAPVLIPKLLQALPSIRTLRCGMSHTLACSESGQVYAWGCGITHQLGNRPQNCEDPQDAKNEPDDELAPYLISSKQLAGRKVVLADGGAQHSVELVALSNDAEQVPESDQDEGTMASYHHGTDSSAHCDPDIDQNCFDSEVIVVTTSDDFWRVQVEAVYRRRNPHKLGNVPNLLDKYKGQEATLYAKVCKTYDLDPLKFYADPQAWEDEDSDVKRGAGSLEPVQDGCTAGPHQEKLIGSLPMCQNSSACGPASSGFLAVAPAGLFQFTATSAEVVAHGESSSDEDSSNRADRREAKQKRLRIKKTSACMKKSPKERRKAR